MCSLELEEFEASPFLIVSDYANVWIPPDGHGTGICDLLPLKGIVLVAFLCQVAVAGTSGAAAFEAGGLLLVAFHMPNPTSNVRYDSNLGCRGEIRVQQED